MKLKIFPLFAVSLLSLTACGTKEYSPDKYILKLDYKSDFRILQLTDLHIGDKDNQELHYKFLDLTIAEANPDFIVVTGDLFTFSSQATAVKLFDYLDSKGKPWTVTYGNHDEQCYFSVDWLTGYLNKLAESKDSKCLFKDIQDDNVNGNCNFAINLMQGDNIHDQIIVMDSNRYYYGDYFGYDYFKQDQIDWYTKIVNYTKEQNGGVTVPSMMFYHIPLPEINDAWEKGEKLNATAYRKGELQAGGDVFEERETTCPPDENSGFFKKIKDLGSTKAMFFGHDHRNNFIVKYDDVIFGYGIKSTDRIYCDEDMMGGRTIIVHDDHSLSFESYYHTYEEVK